jgi:predicted nuclease of predicted toxin-antitoxin system
MPARFKVDENLPAEIAELLNSRGHDAVTVADQGWSGLPDNLLGRRIQQEDRWIVTADKGFGDVRHHPPGSHAGVLLLRSAEEGLDDYLRLATEAVGRVDFDDAAGAVVVVTNRGVRIRKVP